MKTANERLVEVRIALGFQKKADFAEKVGIERSTYDKMEKGPHKPSADNLEKIALKFSEVNLNWLLLEQGPMLFLEGSEPSAQLPPQVPSEAKPYHEGLPTVPGTATPKEINFVGQLIERLEKELAQAQADKEYLQGLVTELLGKSQPSLDAAAYYSTPRNPLGFGAVAATCKCVVRQLIPTHLEPVALAELSLAAGWR